MKGIVKLIHDKGLTVTGAAKHTNISTVSIYNWDKGLSNPKLGHAVMIANYLGMSTDELYHFGITI